MQTHEQYYHMANGQWVGVIEVKIKDWRSFLVSPLSPINKLRFGVAVLAQKVLQPIEARTRVDFSIHDRAVNHVTRILKWGICFYEGQERVSLSDNGTDLILEGHGYIWPLMKRKAFIFEGAHGRIHPSGTEATYQASMLGVEGRMTTQISKDEGVLRFQNDWAEGRFTLRRAGI